MELMPEQSLMHCQDFSGLENGLETKKLYNPDKSVVESANSNYKKIHKSRRETVNRSIQSMVLQKTDKG